MVGRNPEVCQSTMAPEVGMEYHARMMTRENHPLGLPVYYCKSMPIVTIDYKFNPKLTVMLSLVSSWTYYIHTIKT